MIHADGCKGFNALFGPDLAGEQACMVHARRTVVDGFEKDGSVSAKEALERIASLYAVKKAIRRCAPEARVARRPDKAKPVFDELERWLAAQLPKISGKSNPAQAIRCALDRLPKARPHLENGQLERDTNIRDRSIRPIALGRKNHLFMGSIGGGRAAATAYSPIETARMKDVNPEAWPTWVLTHVADHKVTVTFPRR